MGRLRFQAIYEVVFFLKPLTLISLKTTGGIFPKEEND